MRSIKVAAPSEEAEQAAVVWWLHSRRVLFCHVPNGGYRHPATAARLKATGVQAGVPDLLIFSRPPNKKQAVGVALEMKKQGCKRASPSQQKWLQALEERHWVCSVQPGAAAAIGWLVELGY